MRKEGLEFARFKKIIKKKSKFLFQMFKDENEKNKGKYFNDDN
jgi:hypothetical protein